MSGRGAGRRRLACAAVLLATLLVGCGTAAGDDAEAPDPACPPPDIEMRGAIDIVARCQRVLSIANARLGSLHWPVTDVEVRWNLCPTGGRGCNVVQLSQAWVIYRFSVGDPTMINVGPRLDGDGIVDDLVAGAPEPVPDWLRDEPSPEEQPGSRPRANL